MFHPSSLLLTALTAAASTNALYFQFSPFVAGDYRLPSDSHLISFTVSNPTADFAEGGPAPRNISIAWNGTDIPTCWTISDGSGYPYFARVTPDSYKSAEEFQLDVQEYHIYQAPEVFNVTAVPIVEGGGLGGYTCSQGGQSTVCTFQNEAKGFNVTVGRGGDPVQPSPLC
ncbi:hypothetical protein DOTSEDRAFT_75447 [Dothistroma septosporum NZE10]|uniref:AA1-like domain-containing protein n=1 Tax=Dothistroma septosporum (strain NZE10 / CBS 128990) TaxID=675120 RepID=M2YIF8_DOTSN|nr:hypothetical protein DOTSEDRAFT_75447 [Dothistroma septosporum NZE10]